MRGLRLPALGGTCDKTPGGTTRVVDPNVVFPEPEPQPPSHGVVELAKRTSRPPGLPPLDGSSMGLVDHDGLSSLTSTAVAMAYVIESSSLVPDTKVDCVASRGSPR